MTRPAATIYQGEVVHVRYRTRRHRLSYRVFSLLLDIDRLEEVAQTTWLFRHNRAGLVSFHDRDHGDGDDHLRAWVEQRLTEAGLPRPHRIELLCYPRILGYAFNPLSVWFCRDADDRLFATVHEVRNTFGGRHAYVLPADPAQEGALIRRDADKEFLVSPFNPVTGRYRFRIRPPGDSLSVIIRHVDDDGPVLDAGFTARRRPFGTAGLLKALAIHPFMTHKVMAGIHWEALKLWLKGVPFLGGPGRQQQAGTAREQARQG